MATGLSLLNNSRQLEEFAVNAGVPTVDLSIWREDLDFEWRLITPRSGAWVRSISSIKATRTARGPRQ